MSYRKHHIKSRINRIKPKKSLFKMPWFWILLLILIIIFSGAYFLFFYSGFQVKNIVISGNEKVNVEDLRNVATTGINKKILGLFNSKSIFLISKDNLNKEILKDFPTINKLTIKKQLPQTLFLGIEERKPIGIFCDKTENCFLIDNNGIIFEGLETTPQDMLIVRQELENGQIFTGENVVTDNIINTITKIQKNLKDNFQIDLKEALITTPLRLDIKTNENWQIYFGTDEDSNINLQLTRLNLLLNGDITKEIRKTLQYIDLRFKDRAYYK